MSTPPQKYPMNCWYVAATSDEVGRAPLARQLLDIRVVLYRQASGHAVGLEDRCAHRSFPLSAGWLDGDLLVCAYHGFAYDCAGACVRVPSQPHVPAGMRVRTFPVREDPPYIWIWLGEPSLSALTPPPRLPLLSDPTWASFGLSRLVAANYMLLHEHHLDITYLWIVHREDVPMDVNLLPPAGDVEVSETSVAFRRSVPGMPVTDWEADAMGIDRQRTYDRYEYATFVSPALAIKRWEIRGDGDRTYEIAAMRAFTPASESTTHVFSQFARNYGVDRPSVTDMLRTMLERHMVATAEIVETVEANAAQYGSTWGVRVTADRAAMQARRIVNAMLEKETGRSALRPGFSRMGAR
jgi:vanillate O-demethylase monooxygenase subunit